MNYSAENLYKSILYRAADIYDVEYEDVERDVGQNFDPIVRFMAGACASELERVYQHLHDTESRLQKRLAKILLPEYFHLPQPAHALATARAANETLLIAETTAFATASDEEEEIENFAFAPLFSSRILPASIELIATKTKLVNLSNRPKLRRKADRQEKEEVHSILVGIKSDDVLTNWQAVSLFFDLKGSSADESEKARFFAAVSNSRCKFGDYLLHATNGLPKNNLILEDYLNGNEKLQAQLRARYDRQFLSFSNNEIPTVEPQLAADKLKEWFVNTLSVDELNTELAKLNPELTEPLYWLEIQLSKPVELLQIEARLSIRLNVFPVVNRRLNGNGNGEHHYLRNNSIKWISLKPMEDFVSIRRVYEEVQHGIFTFKPFADFKEESKPAYTLRHGGVGRWDDFNAWQRLAYVVTILQDNYKQKELIEKAADSLSLEDVHHLLGKRILKSASIEKPTRDIYVLLHAGISSGIRVRVEYWTSQGAAANNIASKTILKCTSKERSSLDADTIQLLSTASEGRDPLNATEQLSAMKNALLSRGRIVTREDVKIYCQSFLNNKLEEVKVKDGVGTDPRFDFGMTRLLDVVLKPTREANKEDWEGICQQLQVLLEQKSTSSIPIRVSVGI